MHVVVNAAMSVDGKLSSRRREQIPISGPDDFTRVDDLRAGSDAIMVGVGTVIADDPRLTVDRGSAETTASGDASARGPVRVVADSRARTPTEARVLEGGPPTYVLTGENAPAERRRALEAAGATVVETSGERVDLAEAIAALEDDGVGQLMVEGGGELIFSLFAADLVDELTVFVGSSIIGGRDAPTLADGDGFVEDFPALELTAVDRLDGGVLLRYRC